MRYLLETEREQALSALKLAAKIASHASCERDKCGSIIVQQGEVIGLGFNSPPGAHEAQRRCTADKSLLHPKVIDKTCCVHAEQRAIMDALKHNASKLAGSRLYFMRLAKDNTPQKSGMPYCTLCSKMALDAGIDEFVLWHEQGIAVYDTKEYNLVSFQYQG